MLIGYARVSTHEQTLESQLLQLKTAKCDRIYNDVISGTKDNRPGLTDLMADIREGDTLVVWRMDRLGRSLKHLLTIVEELKGKGVHFWSLHESIDTNTATGNFVFHIFAALAEFERALIVERTLAGLAAARSRGRCGGRPKALTPEMVAIAQGLYDSKRVSIDKICQHVGVSKPTLYKYIKKDESKYKRYQDV